MSGRGHEFQFDPDPLLHVDEQRQRLIELPRLGEDLAAIPGVVRAYPRLGLPLALLLIGLITFILLPDVSPQLAGLPGYYIQFVFAPPALLTFLLVGLLAPRAGYLFGYLYGLIAGVIWSVAVLTVGSATDPSDLFSNAIDQSGLLLNLLVIGMVYGTILASIGRLAVKGFQALASRSSRSGH